MAESIQKRLTREKPPRVKITYDVETLGSAVKTELPFVMGIVADLSGDKNIPRVAAYWPKTTPVGPWDENLVAIPGVTSGASVEPLALAEYEQRDFVQIDRYNFAEVMKSVMPIAAVSVGKDPNKISCNIPFGCLDDFSPDSLVRRIGPLYALREKRNAIKDYRTRLDADNALFKAVNAAFVVENGAVDGETAKTTLAALDNKSDLAGYLSGRAEEYATLFAADPEKANILNFLAADVADVDRQLSEYVDEILHHKSVKELEAVWRGLFYLVSNTETGPFLKLRVLNASRDEVENDLARAVAFDQSMLFKKVYEETYGTLGGEPYSCLLYADEFSHSDKDVAFLRNLMLVAAAAHAPLLTAASHELFEITGYPKLAVPGSLADIIGNKKHLAWRGLRDEEDARYLNLVLPRVLLRMPYSADKIATFAYNESLGDAANPDHDLYLWGNAAFFLAQRVTKAYALYHWTAAIRGVEGGGLVENLPSHTYVRASGDVVVKIPTEIAITDRREKELSDLGLIALCYRVNTDKAAFLGGQSLHKPLEYTDPEATSNSKLSARLPYLLNASRFAHYVKVKMRDKVGSFLDRESIETYLNNWISDYVLLSDTGSQDLKAKYPLREARVEVTEEPGDPGSYSAVIHLRPHFQMEELLVSLRLVAKLPAGAE